MKKLFLIFALISILYLNENVNSKIINENINQPVNSNQLLINDEMNYLVELGYVLQTQETRGITTLYLFKKGNDFAGCRVERSIKKQIEKCYQIELVNSQDNGS